DIAFTMRYTKGLRRDYGPYLSLRVDEAGLKVSTAGAFLRVTGTLTENHPADLTVSVRTADGVPLALLPGTRVGTRTLRGHSRAFSVPAGASISLPLRLVLPMIKGDYTLVVRGRRPHLRYGDSLTAGIP